MLTIRVTIVEVLAGSKKAWHVRVHIMYSHVRPGETKMISDTHWRGLHTSQTGLKPLRIYERSLCDTTHAIASHTKEPSPLVRQ